MQRFKIKRWNFSLSKITLEMEKKQEESEGGSIPLVHFPLHPEIVAAPRVTKPVQVKLLVWDFPAQKKKKVGFLHLSKHKHPQQHLGTQWVQEWPVKDSDRNLMMLPGPLTTLIPSKIINLHLTESSNTRNIAGIPSLWTAAAALINTFPVYLYYSTCINNKFSFSSARQVLHKQPSCFTHNCNKIPLPKAVVSLNSKGNSEQSKKKKKKCLKINDVRSLPEKLGGK